VRKIFIISILLLILFSFGCTAKEEPTIKIGISDDNPPFCSMIDGSPVGIDMDIALNIIRVLEFPYEISVMSQDDIALKLETGELDLGFVYLEMNEAPSADIHYSLPYFEGTRDEEAPEIYRYMLAMPKEAKMNDDIMAALDDLIASGELASIMQTHIN